MAQVSERVFRVTPPNGDPFYAAIVIEPGSMHVISTRDGAWAKDKQLQPEDLVMPEHELNEWDIVRVDPASAPARPVTDTAKGP